jgi:hypothetical protein
MTRNTYSLDNRSKHAMEAPATLGAIVLENKSGSHKRKEKTRQDGKELM